MFCILILWLLIIFFSILLLKLIKVNKNLIICFLLSLLTILFVLDLENSMNSAIEGSKLWFNAILPTIFPFLVICNLLISYDGINLYAKILGPLICKPLGLSKVSAFPITASILCGYPLGAKYTSEIYKNKYIDICEYKRLLNIATNCGPLFIIGPIAVTMLQDIKLSYILIISNYLTPFLIGLFTRKHKVHNSKEIIVPSASTNQPNFGIKFKNAIDDAIKTCFTIGAFIIIFSVIIGIIKNNVYFNIVFYKLEYLLNIPKHSLYSLFLGSIEITNGCNLICDSTLGLHIKLSIISFLCSFSGLCIIAQVSAFVNEKVSLLKYSLLKVLQGIISACLTFIISLISLPALQTFSITTEPTNTFNILFYFIPITIFICLTLIIYILKKLLFHVS